MGLFNRNKKKQPDKNKINYYCQYCHSTFDFYMRTANLINKTLYMRCPDCLKPIQTRPITYEPKPLLVEDSWQTIGSKVSVEEKEEMMKLVEDDEEQLKPKQEKPAKKKYHCKHCEEPFGSPVEVKNHYRKKHNVKLVADKEEDVSPETPTPNDDVYDDTTVEEQPQTADYVEPSEHDVFPDIVGDPNEEGGERL